LPWKAAESLESIVQHINYPPKDIRKLVPDIDETVAETIMKGLQRDPDDRWPSMTAMLKPLRDAQQRLEGDSVSQKA